MKNANKFSLTIIFSAIIFSTVFAQDKIFKYGGDSILCKIVEVTSTEIKYKLQNTPESPYHTIRKIKVDSVTLADGRSSLIRKLVLERREPTHLTTKNTFSVDPLGLLASSITTWYERRVWNGNLGIRIPLYLCFNQNYSPGFVNAADNIPNPNPQKGFAFAAGINPKFYLNKNKIARVFAGPEADLGYTAYPRDITIYDGFHLDDAYYPYYHRTGNFQAAGMMGVNINPIGHFNITIEGGAGYNIAFAKNYKSGNPIWRVGLSLGGNF